MIYFNEIKGQEAAKRALEISLAGMQSLHIIGPPGNGKTMLRTAAFDMVEQVDDKQERKELLWHLQERVFEDWPCPCGYYGHSVIECTCTFEEIREFQKRWPKATMRIYTQHVSLDKLWPEFEGEKNEAILNRILEARKMLKQEPLPGPMPDEAKALLKRAVDSLGLSARDFRKVHRIAHTIAALDGYRKILVVHIAEACQYTPRIAHG